MRLIYADYNPYTNSIDVNTFENYILRIDVYKRQTTEMSVLTETKDLKAVIEYVRNLSYTDSEKILLMGCSQGGFVSA